MNSVSVNRAPQPAARLAAAVASLIGRFRHCRSSASHRSEREVIENYRLVSRQPAASASSTEQNQRVPLLIFISILAYQRLVGW